MRKKISTILEVMRRLMLKVRKWTKMIVRAMERIQTGEAMGWLNVMRMKMWAGNEREM
jgi:hypothetical protein